MRALHFWKPPLMAIDAGTAMIRVAAAASLQERPARAMCGGVVDDVAGVAAVMEPMVRKASSSGRRPGALVCAPSDASADEKEALIAAVSVAGASVMTVAPEPLAAAIGAGVDVSSGYATAIVDIGEGVTDFAIIRSAGVVHAQALRIRLDAGSIDTIVDFIAAQLRDVPDRLAAEVIESGLHVAGGGAAMPHLVAAIAERSRMTIHLPSDPLHCVIHGASQMLRVADRLAARH
jgi:rod shape-determining protein MreB